MYEFMFLFLLQRSSLTFLYWPLHRKLNKNRLSPTPANTKYISWKFFIDFSFQLRAIVNLDKHNRKLIISQYIQLEHMNHWPPSKIKWIRKITLLWNSKLRVYNFALHMESTTYVYIKAHLQGSLSVQDLTKKSATAL